MMLLSETLNIQFVDQMPLTVPERNILADNIALRATLIDYLEFSLLCQYPKTEYFEGHILSFLGNIMAKFNHEVLASKLSQILNNLVDDHDLDYKVASSNLKVYLEESNQIFMPDISVFLGKPATFLYESNNKSEQICVRPFLVIEILSKSTENYDKNHKIPAYQQEKSLKQIILIDQDQYWVQSYEKVDGVWQIPTTYENIDEIMLILDFPVALKEIYKKVNFEGK